jgi:hypothetical protein
MGTLEMRCGKRRIGMMNVLLSRTGAYVEHAGFVQNPNVLY